MSIQIYNYFLLVLFESFGFFKMFLVFFDVLVFLFCLGWILGDFKIC